MYYVYELWNPIKNTPFYVGIGKQNRNGSSNDRHDDHLKESLYYQRNNKLSKGANLHKINTILQIINSGYDLDIKIVMGNLSEDEVKVEEIKLIKYYGRADLNKGPLTNLTDGGDGFLNMSPIIKEKISSANKGKPAWNKGKTLGPYTDERKQITREKTIAKKKQMTEEEKAIEHHHRSKSQQGKVPWNKGLDKSDPRVAKFAKSKEGVKRPDMVGNEPWNKGLTKDNDSRLHEASKKLTGRVAWNKGKTSPNKGKTYEEIYGLEKATELKNRRKEVKEQYWRDKK